MAGYPVTDPAGVDIIDVDGTVTHYAVGDVVPLAKLLDRRYSWLVERGRLSETETGFGGGAGTWGSITGTLSSQTDLQNALNSKAASSHTHSESEVTGLVADLALKANLASPTFTGTATFTGPVDLVSAQLTASTNTISVTTAVLIDSFDSTLYRSCEYTLQFTQGPEYSMTKLLVIHNGTNVGISEYGIAETGTPIDFSISTNFSGATLEMLLTFPTANLTPVSVKLSRVLYDA